MPSCSTTPRQLRGVGVRVDRDNQAAPGRRVAFYDSLSRLGFLLELVERSPRVFEMIVAQHQRHLERDKHPMIMA